MYYKIRSPIMAQIEIEDKINTSELVKNRIVYKVPNQLFTLIFQYTQTSVVSSTFVRTLYVIKIYYINSQLKEQYFDKTNETVLAVEDSDFFDRTKIAYLNKLSGKIKYYIKPSFMSK